MKYLLLNVTKDGSFSLRSVEAKKSPRGWVPQEVARVLLKDRDVGRITGSRIMFDSENAVYRRCLCPDEQAEEFKRKLVESAAQKIAQIKDSATNMEQALESWKKANP